MTAEEWRPVAGSRFYTVSSLGRVRSSNPRRSRCGERELSGFPDRKGYRRVFIYIDGQRHERYVHHLVAEAFIGPRPEGMDTRHLDGDKTNNAASNLRYGTRSENELDKVRHGTHQNSRKTHCPAGHPYSVDNTYVTPGRGDRMCRTCARTRRTAAAFNAAGVDRRAS